eukprot:6370861-Prymnesium_polylepis.2
MAVDARRCASTFSNTSSAATPLSLTARSATLHHRRHSPSSVLYLWAHATLMERHQSATRVGT